MSQRLQFWISILASFAAVLLFGAAVFRYRLGELGKRSVFEGLPTERFKSSFQAPEFDTASSINALLEALQKQAEMIQAATSVSETPSMASSSTVNELTR